MNRILVPTDFSEEAENALLVASNLAKRFNSKLILLHVLEIPLTEIDPLSSHSALPEAMFFVKLAKQRFRALKKRKYLEGIPLKEKVLRSSIFEGIAQTSVDENVNMIVMGSHGASGFKEMFVGSNAEKVVRTSKVPVLIIKENEPNFEVKKFVFASNFQDENRDTFKQATEIAELLGAKLHLLNVDLIGGIKSQIEAKNRIKDFVRAYSFQDYTFNVIKSKSVEKGILDFSQNINADLIGLSTHGRQGISHFLNGSIGEDVANHALRPVITFRI